MSTLSIRPVADAPLGAKFRASFDGNESVGDTPGEALNALVARIGPASPSHLVVLIDLVSEPDLSDDQRRRLNQLKRKYKLASAGRGTMSAAERAEMEHLFDVLFAASERRALSLPRGDAT